MQFTPAWAALGESYFVRGRRNLLWYAVLAVIPLAGRSLVSPAPATLTVIAASGALFVLALFAFPAIAAWRGDRITLNRATPQFAPVAVIFTVAAFQAFRTRRSRIGSDRQTTTTR